ncbi:glycoside hydrolase domain-containing protein [Micrococcus porci]|uniref:glycoside hydrolase domain-containing protein n=1 Tax=Micrococcus porci TaxID=2856555 RepID=UPI003CEB5BC4
MDERVVDVQNYLNAKYLDSGLVGMSRLDVNGRTGWPVMRALTRALQYEIGLTTFSDSFGPSTTAALLQNYPSVGGSTATPQIRTLVQCALWCKGYYGGTLNAGGAFDAGVDASIVRVKNDMGVGSVYPGPTVVPKVFKSLLTMDAYVPVAGGTAAVSEVQRWMNGRYAQRSSFNIVPCDGNPSRDVAKALFYVIQYELGLSDAAANGVFGPTTQDGLRKHTLSVGATGVWARIFTGALILNRRNISFGDYTQAVASEVKNFQAFYKLPITGTANYQTWAALLISYGDKDRPGTAADCVTKITKERALALKASGITTVGRYLSARSNSTLPEKVIQPGELVTIQANGLRCFPIYQTSSNNASYFSPTQGRKDAAAAIEWARYFGFMPGTTIYFAVDYDAVNDEVTDYIIPHFRAISEGVRGSSSYKVGIYGARNICQRVSDAGYATASFVCDMSSGFSGNLGYPLPSNWAFDQIATIKVGAGVGLIEIDKNVASGTDLGQSSFLPMVAGASRDLLTPSVAFDRILPDIQTYLVSIGVPERGGETILDGDIGTFVSNSTTDAFNVIRRVDPFITNVCSRLGIRKALVQSVVMWEIRKYNPLDYIADEQVLQGLRDDATTGLGQIFGRVAIKARNYCVDSGYLNDSKLSDAQLLEVWNKLRSDEQYNVETAAYLTMWNGYDLGMPRVNWDISQHSITQLLARYNGINEDAAQYGAQLKGVYDQFEKYNARVRSGEFK